MRKWQTQKHVDGGFHDVLLCFYVGFVFEGSNSRNHKYVINSEGHKVMYQVEKPGKVIFEVHVR